MTIFNWKPGINADWNTPSAWVLGAVPNSALADVTINAPGTPVTIGALESILTHTVTLAAGSLTVQNTAKLTANGLFVGGGPVGPAGFAPALTVFGTVFDTGVLDVWAGSTLSVTATGGVDVGTSGRIIAGSVLVEAGKTLAGDGLVSAFVVNNGAINVVANHVGTTPGKLEITRALTGTGTVNLAPTSILQLDGVVLAATQTFNFGAAGAETLILNAIKPAAAATSITIANKISGLNVGDRIEFGAVSSITSALITAPNTVTIATNLGNYVLTGVSFAAGANQQLVPVFDTASGKWGIEVAAKSAVWSPSRFGGTTNLATPNNWSTVSGVSSTVPTASEALFFNGALARTLTGIGQGLDANFSGPASWTLQGATLTLAGKAIAPAQPIALLDSAASLTVIGGTLLAGGSGDIGAAASATMTAEGGAQVTFQGTTLGSAAGQTGSLTVTGVGTAWQNSLATGTLYGGNIEIGVAASTATQAGGVGSVTVTAGASMIDTATDIIGVNAGSSGILTVSAGGSVADSGLTVGLRGKGVLAVSGGTVTTKGLTVGKLGSISLSGGSLSAASVTLNAGATLSGNGTVTGSVTDNGTINAAGGLLKLSGTVSGNGSLTIGNGATLEVGATAATATGASDSISFLGTTGLLVVHQAGTVADTIAGYGGGNMIDLAALHFVAGATASVAAGVVTVKSGALTEILHVTGIANGSTFRVTADAAGTGTLIGLPGGTAAGYPITGSSAATSLAKDVFRFDAGAGHDIIDDFRSNPVTGVGRLQIGDHDSNAAMFDHSVAVAASAAAGHFGLDTTHLMSAVNGSDFRLA